MKIKINKSVAIGEITVTPSKSHLHRLLIISAFCEAETEINNFAICDDIKATIDCLSCLGAEFEFRENSVLVRGINPERVHKNIILNCNESGSTLRMLLPVVLVTCKDVTFTGSERLFDRIKSDVVKFLKAVNVDFSFNNNSLIVTGKLKSADYIIDCSHTSQLFSGLCIALSLIEGKSTIKAEENTVSKPYIELTVAQLSLFGADIVFDNGIFTISKKIFAGNRSFYAEGDWSCGANFLLLGKFGNISVNGLFENSIQPDKIVLRHLTELSEGYCKIDLDDSPDLAPVLFVAAALYHGAEFFGVSRLKDKECDRLNCMCTELNKCGVTSKIHVDSVEIISCGLHSPSAPFETYNDHRIAMALSVLATLVGGVINDAECVSKSSPAFFDLMRNLSVDIESL